MRVCPEVGQSNWFWVDREIDGRADHFAPCPDCHDALAQLGQRPVWQESDLCPECDMRLEIEGAIAGLKGERPLIFTSRVEQGSAGGMPTPIWQPLDPADFRRRPTDQSDLPPLYERVP